MVDLSKFEALPWVSGTPSMADVVANQHNPARLAADQIRAAFRTTEIAGGRAWLSRSKRVAAQVAPSQALEAFQKLSMDLEAVGPSAASWLSAGAAAAEGDYDAILDGTLASIQDAALQSVSEMPVLGAVAGFFGLAVNVGKAIWLEAQDSKGLEYSQPLTLNSEADQKSGRRIMDSTTAVDWTPLFLPEHDPSAGGYLQVREVKYATKHKGAVLWIGGQSGDVVPLGEGLVPGAASVARLWQTRMKQATTGSTRLDNLARLLKIPIAQPPGYEELTVYGLGYFQPSLPQISQILWAQINRPGPDMFRVDARALVESWDHYWKIWLTTFSQLIQDNRLEAAEIVWRILTENWISTDTFSDWPKVNRPELVGKLPEEYRDLVSISMQPTGKMLHLGGGKVTEEKLPEYGEGLSWFVTNRGVTRRYCQNLRERQAATLRTLEIAYLTGQEPGITGSLKQDFKDNRKLLLDHPDRAKVDMHRVPPGPWKDELAKRRKQGIQGFKVKP